jgi:hypothetical protein
MGGKGCSKIIFKYEAKEDASLDALDYGSVFLRKTRK